MKASRLFLVLGIMGLAVAIGVVPCAVPSVLAAADSSGQSMSGQKQMKSQSPQSQSSSDRQMQSGKGAMQSSKGDVPIQLSSASLKKVQEQLSQKGFKVGNPDGVWGKSTTSAMKDFQKSQGLAPTGKLDIESIQSLNAQDIISSESSGQAMGEQKGQKAVPSGAQLYISPSQLRDIQQSLKDQGYDPGEANGSWDSKTQKAISSYQKDQGMQPSGHIDIGMLEKMGMSQVVAVLGIGSSASGMAQQPSDKGQARGYFGDESQQKGGAGRVQGTGAPLYAGTDMIRQVQQALKSAGEDPGQTDGKWSNQTQAALKRYQQSQNLPATGTLTIGTIQKLVGSSGFDSSGQPQSEPGQPMGGDQGRMNEGQGSDSMQGGQGSGMQGGQGSGRDGSMNRGQGGTSQP